MSGVTKAQLRNVITEIDGVSQSEFGAIAALARLALSNFENTMTRRDIHTPTAILLDILAKAKAAKAHINATAYEADCSFESPDQLHFLQSHITNNTGASA